MKDNKISTFPVIAIIVSSIGIIGYWVIRLNMLALQNAISAGVITEEIETYISIFRFYNITLLSFSTLVLIGIMLVFIGQYIKKSLFGLLVGLSLFLYIIITAFIEHIMQRV